MIHFKLKHIEEILPWGQEPDRSMHWFGLTDGDLWLTFGNETVYEYTQDVLDYFGNKPSRYNDYQLARFVEDFTAIFDTIREPVSEKLYELTADLFVFHQNTRKWTGLHDSDEFDFDVFFDQKYEPLTSWINLRTLYSRHLMGGPFLSFFRRREKIRIVWETEHAVINGNRAWTANNGSMEMDYPEFVAKIREFGSAFFNAMDQQTLAANEQDWGDVSLDKHQMLREQRARKEQFYRSLQQLEEPSEGKTDWKPVEAVVNLMTNELKLHA